MTHLVKVVDVIMIIELFKQTGTDCNNFAPLMSKASFFQQDYRV